MIKGQAIYLPEQGVYQLFEMYFVNQNVINQSDNDFENQISPQTLLSGNNPCVSTKDSNDKFYISDYEQTFSNHSDNVSLITTQPDLYTTPISSSDN